MLQYYFYLALFLAVLHVSSTPLVAAESVKSNAQSTSPAATQGSVVDPTAPTPPIADPTRSKSGPDPLKKATQTSAEKGLPAKKLPPPDRRWIIKDPQFDPKQIKKAPARKVKWENTAQKKQCEAYLSQIGSIFLKARYYSIQGDSCACAENADYFLDLYRRTEASCPDNYLEGAGFTSRIERNMSWLSALGQEQCMGSAKAPANAPAKLQMAPSGGVDTPIPAPPDTAPRQK